MVLLWGPAQDNPLVAVRHALHRRGCPVVFLDQRDLLRTGVELTVDTDLRGELQTGGQILDLAAITAVYIRTHDWRRFAEIEEAGPGSPAWRHALAVQDALVTWLGLTPALVVNRLTAMATNSSKPSQASVIRSLGFDVPDTLITTDPAAARKFWEEHGTVVYKSISSVRSIVSRLASDHVRRLSDISWCPTQFQQYIPGREYRVHVVGNEVFACEIVSAADDYRYAGRHGGTVTIRACDLPEECSDRCRALAAAMDLVVTGIDLRRSPEGRWYCFEANSAPGFTYYQAATNQPIDEAIARLLAEGAGVRSSTTAGS